MKVILLLIFKILLLLISALCLIHSLREVSKKKTMFQIYPDTIKEGFLKKIKYIAILNYIAVIPMLTACYFINSKIYFILIFIPVGLSLTAIEFICEDFNMFEDENDNKK